MATWEDGPEYAPHERPQYFADAPVAPLEEAPPVARPADGQPASRPRFDEPAAAVAPLATLVPEPPDERDPHRPFDTLTTTMTSASWGASDQPFVATAPFTATTPSLAAAPTTPASLSAPSPTALPPGPTGPGPVVQGPVGQGQPAPGQLPQQPYGFPVPGTPEWFAPPPATYGEQQQPGRVDAKQVVEAATPGLCITLAVGGLIYPLAPIMLVVAVVLSTRVRVAQRAVRLSFRIAAGAVAFFALVGLVRSVFDGNPWWHFVSLWSLLICWVMLGVTLLVVWQTLTRPKPPSTNPWG